MANCESNVVFEALVAKEIAEPVIPLADIAVEPALIGELASITTAAA
ncbi:hypothetical protein [Bacillus subtilis]